MRTSYNDLEIYTTDEEHGGVIYGVSLGYDFCAEHEWGVQKLHATLGVKGVSKKTPGTKGRLIHNADAISHGTIQVHTSPKSYHVNLTPHKSGNIKHTLYYFECCRYYGDEGSINKRRIEGIYAMDFTEEKKRELWCAWDDSSFRIVTSNKGLYEVLVNALENKTLTVGFGKQSNPFARSPLNLVDSSAFPEVLLEEIKKTDLEAIGAKEYSDKYVAKFKKAWKRQHNEEPDLTTVTYLGGKEFASDTELKQLEAKGRKTKVKMLFWLNTNNRSYKSGWYTYEELLQWVKGEGLIVKQPQEV